MVKDRFLNIFKKSIVKTMFKEVQQIVNDFNKQKKGRGGVHSISTTLFAGFFDSLQGINVQHKPFEIEALYETMQKVFNAAQAKANPFLTIPKQITSLDDFESTLKSAVKERFKKQ
jgi:hypothetical protein